MWRIAFPVFLVLAITACGGGDDQVRDFNSRAVTLPDGTSVTAEVMTHQADMSRGMMFRDSLPEGKGMLFIHQTPGQYPYWMYQVKIPLDIVWMDSRGTVVEISESTPPCTGQQAECPNYGGTRMASVVLELPGGYARKHGVAVGQTIRF
jgi:uncharacterized membrane protein (UPF0127 family)